MSTPSVENLAVLPAAQRRGPEEAGPEKQLRDEKPLRDDPCTLLLEELHHCIAGVVDVAARLRCNDDP